MSDLSERLKSSLGDGAEGEALIKEIDALREQRDQLEEILILLVRTGLPWDEEGRLGENFPHFKERYEKAMHEAARLLGLDRRSTITRTEPRT